MKTNLIFILLINYTFCLSQNRIEETIYFKVDRYDLTAEESNTINGILDQIKGYDVKQIYLSGHTDSDGSLAYNYALSKRRVHTIQKYFLDRGYPIDSANITYAGELNPKISNSSNLNKQKNRRVEILISYEDTSNLRTKDSSKAIYKDTKTQMIKFPSSEGIDFLGEQGTRIKIRPNMLINPEGKEARGELTMKLKEYYLKPEMILSGLQTLSDENRLLETAGMIHLEFRLNDLALGLKDGETIYIEIPNKKGLKVMDFFSKEEDEDKWTKATSWTWESQMKDNVLEKFIFKSPKLGWINCDRFVDVENLVDINIQVDDTVDTRVCIVFKSINAVLNSARDVNGFKFNNIPAGEEISIIAFKLSGEDYSYAQKEVFIEKDANHRLALKVVSKDLFDKLIKQFN